MEETLRDKLVCGLSDQQIQNRNCRIAESKLKLTKAVEIAVAMETATRDGIEIHDDLREEKPLNELTMNRSKSFLPTPVPCYRCAWSKYTLQVSVDLRKKLVTSVVREAIYSKSFSCTTNPGAQNLGQVKQPEICTFH